MALTSPSITDTKSNLDNFASKHSKDSRDPASSFFIKSLLISCRETRDFPGPPLPGPGNIPYDLEGYFTFRKLFHRTRSMPQTAPFAALRYNLDHIGSLSDVIAPPYDVIDPIYRTNFTRSTLPTASE